MTRRCRRRSSSTLCFLPKPPAVFGCARVADLVGQASAVDHNGLCRYLVQKMNKEPDADFLRRLPAFTVLADAAMEVMDKVGEVLARSPNRLGLTVSEVASVGPVRELCNGLWDSAKVWSREARTTLPRGEAVEALADGLANASKAADRIAALVRHHERYGGGVKWFVLRNGRIMPGTSLTAGGSSRYRFRLWPLARLASQCGRIDGVPDALSSDLGSRWEDPVEDGDDDGGTE